MFDIGWSEMAIIMLLALIIIGPKDLPRVARTVGQWVRKGRMLAREFQNSLDDMVRDTELEDVKKEIEKVGRTDFKKSIENTIDPKGELTKAFDTSADDAKGKPALTEMAGAGDSKADGKKAPTTATANGHAGGMTAPSDETSPVADTAKTPAAKAKSTAKTAAKTKKAAAKPAVAKSAASKKPASPAKRTATTKSASATSPKAKRTTAKRSPVEPASVDEGGSPDQAAVAAKSS